MDSTQGYQSVDVPGYDWREFQAVCPDNGRQFMCSGGVDAMITSTVYQFDHSHVAAGGANIDLNVSLARNPATTRTTSSLKNAENSNDGWLSRDPAAPNPATVAFIGISLVGLAWSRPTKA